MPEEVYQPFVGLDVWTILFQWGNLLILFLLIKRFLFKPIKKIIHAREEEIAKIYDDADQAKSQAEKLREDYDGKIAQAKSEAVEIVRNATATAQNKSEFILREAQEKAGAIHVKAQADIEREKKQAFQEVKGEISDIALMIASKVVKKELKGADQERLIEEFIDGVGDTKWKM